MRQKDLIEKSKEGDEASFNALFSLYKERIFYTCLGIVKDQESAEDLTQETFIQAYTHLSSFKGNSSFYTWLYRIAHNLSLNHVKKKGRIKEDALIEELYANPVPPQTPENREFQELLEKSLSTLSEKHRLVYVMCEIEKRPQKEVAALLSIKEGTVRSRLFNARKKIRLFFEKINTE
jgi:RNA polymerase sigma-70 factor (ECF subfamily)